MSVPCWGCQLPLPTGVTYCPRCGASLADDTEIETDATRLGPRPGPAQAGPGPYQPAAYGTPPPPQPWQSPSSGGGSGAWSNQSLPPRTFQSAESLPPQGVPRGLTAPPTPPVQGRTARTALALGIAFAVLVLLGVGVGFFRGPLLTLVGLQPATTAPIASSAVPRPTISTTSPTTPAAKPTSSATASPTPSATPSRPSATPSRSTPASPPPTTTTPKPPITVTVARTCGSTGKGDCFLTERTQPTGDSPAVKQWPEKATLTVVCQVQGQSVSSSVLNRASTVWSRTSTGGYVANIFLDGVDAFAITTPC